MTDQERIEWLEIKLKTSQRNERIAVDFLYDIMRQIAEHFKIDVEI